MATTPVTSSGSSGTKSSTSPVTNRMQSIGVDDFTKMLVTELQNQDPTQPMTNTDVMNQVSQIQSIESNQLLTSTLKSVSLGQNIASAGSLIGATVTGTDSKGKSVTGQVSSASISSDGAVLNVGTSSIALTNVTQISPTSGSTSSASGG